MPSSENITAWLWSDISLPPWKSWPDRAEPCCTEETTKSHEPPSRGLRALTGPLQCHWNLSSTRYEQEYFWLPARIRGDAWSRWCQSSREHRRTKILLLEKQLWIQDTEYLPERKHSPADCNPCHSFKRGKPKLFQQTQPSVLALRRAFGKESMATHFWSKEKARVAQPLSSWMQHCWSTEALGIHNMSFTTYYCCCKCWGNVFSDPEKPYCIKMNRNVRTRTNVQNNRVRVKL